MSPNEVIKRRDINARAAIASVCPTGVILAYIVCISIASVRDTYTGGLPMPYFSDTGRDKPGYYVFSIFISIACIMLGVLMVLQYKYVQAWMPERPVKWQNLLASCFGGIAAVGGFLLAIFDTSSYPDIHNYSAYVFFIFIVFHTGFSMLIYRQLYSLHPRFKSLWFFRQLVVVVVVLSFILYIPVGLGIVCPWVRLSIVDCTEITNDQNYCESMVLEGDPEFTKLWKYDDCKPSNLLRSSTQFICIIALMSYIGLYALDPSPEDNIETKVPSRVQHSSSNSAQATATTIGGDPDGRAGKAMQIA